MEACIRKYAEDILSESVCLQGKACVNHRSLKSSKGVDLYFSTDIFSLKKQGDEVPHDKESFLKVLNKNLQSTIFSRAFLNRQGQLCLDLNRSALFQKVLTQVNEEKDRYGVSTPDQQPKPAVTFIHSPCALRCASDSEETKCAALGSGCGLNCCHGTTLSLAEVRLFLLTSVAASILCATGHCVYPSKSCALFDRSGMPLRNILSSNDDEGVADKTPIISVSEFVSALATPPYVVSSEQRAFTKERTVDANLFLSDLHQGREELKYDKNIQQIQVVGADGTPSVPVCLAREHIFRLHHQMLRSSTPREEHEDLISCHVTPSGKSFLVQQSLVLEAMLETSRKEKLSVHSVISCGGVECSLENGRKELSRNADEPSLDDLLSIRKEQISTLYSVRYPDLFQGEQLSMASTDIARAVVVFELLSTDINKSVKVKLPATSVLTPPTAGGVSDGPSAKVPSIPGVFVLYNYARISCILKKHKKLVEQKVYPPLPPISDIDFSLLTNEAEWQLLFHFVLHYPTVVSDAVRIRSVRERETEADARRTMAPLVGVNISINKICLFLVNLSHQFSSYYSQTKILMSPEPQLLGLINARLYLAAAIKQVMLNALVLLGIKPLDEL